MLKRVSFFTRSGGGQDFIAVDGGGAVCVSVCVCVCVCVHGHNLVGGRLQPSCQDGLEPFKLLQLWGVPSWQVRFTVGYYFPFYLP
jgi:hypothetical protein